MKLNLSKQLHTSEGKPMTISDKNDAPWTAGMALANALLADNAKNADTKLTRYQLWLKISRDSEPDFNLEEMKLLKDAALMFPTIFAGQLVDILEKREE
jgi:hypothetical protein